jgi:hypothetical protein
MKEIINNLRKDRIMLRLFIITFLLIGLSCIYILINIRSLLQTPLIPIFNQLPWGEQRLSTSMGIFIPVVLVFTITIFNIILSAIIYKFTPLVSRMLAVTSFLIAIITIIFTFRTIQLVL